MRFIPSSLTLTHNSPEYVSIRYTLSISGLGDNNGWNFDFYIFGRKKIDAAIRSMGATVLICFRYDLPVDRVQV